MKTFAELNFPGRLIAVEGLDGSGKSTQIYLLKRWLEAEGIKVYFSEWNSSELVKSATSKGKKRELLTPTTFSLIHATDFADRYERHLLPLLRAGYVVLCDRYIFTAFARDVVRGCPSEWVRGIYNFAAQPDLTIFFKADLEAVSYTHLHVRVSLGDELAVEFEHDAEHTVRGGVRRPHVQDHFLALHVAQFLNHLARACGGVANGSILNGGHENYSSAVRTRGSRSMASLPPGAVTNGPPSSGAA